MFSLFLTIPLLSHVSSLSFAFSLFPLSPLPGPRVSLSLSTPLPPPPFPHSHPRELATTSRAGGVFSRAVLLPPPTHLRMSRTRARTARTALPPQQIVIAALSPLHRPSPRPHWPLSTTSPRRDLLTRRRSHCAGRTMAVIHNGRHNGSHPTEIPGGAEARHSPPSRHKHSPSTPPPLPHPASLPMQELYKYNSI